MSRLASLLIVLVFGSASAAATDLIVNGNFDTATLSPWVGDGVWDSTYDVNDQIGSSGSMRIKTIAPGSGSASQCVNIQPIVYRFSLWVYVVPPLGLGSHSTAFGSVAWFDGPDCGGTQVGYQYQTPVNSVTSTWELLSADFTPPSGAASALLQLASTDTHDGGVWFTSYFDAVSFVPEPSPPLLAAAALMALAALRRLRPRRGALGGR